MRARKLIFCDEYDTNYLMIAFDDELNICLNDISLSQNSYVEQMFKVILNNSIKSKTFEKKLCENYYFKNKYFITDEDKDNIFLVELYDENYNDNTYENILTMYFNSFFNTNYTNLFDFFNVRFKMFHTFDELLEILQSLFELLYSREYPSKESLENLGFTEEVCNNIFDHNFDRKFFKTEYGFKIWRYE